MVMCSVVIYTGDDAVFLICHGCTGESVYHWNTVKIGLIMALEMTEKQPENMRIADTVKKLS